MPGANRSVSSAAASLWFTLIGILVPGAVFAVALSLASGQAQGWTFYLTVPEVIFEAVVRLAAVALAAAILATTGTVAILPFLRYYVLSRERLIETVKRVAVAAVVFLDSWLVIVVIVGWLNVSGWPVLLLFAAYVMVFTMVMTSPGGEKEVVTSLDGFLGKKASRRTAIATGVGAAALAAADFAWARTTPAAVKATPVSPRPKPNILFVTFDALSAEDMSLYGYRLPTTPNLDAFARQATVFTNFYSASTFTTSSVATILTGLHPSENRIYHIPDRFRGAIADNSLPRLMRAAGYATGASISNPYAWFLADSLTDAFDVLPEPPYRTGTLKHLWDAGAPLHQRAPLGSRAQEFADLETAWDYVPDFLEKWSPRRFGRLRSGYPPAAGFEQARAVMSKLGDGYFLWVHVMAPHLPYLPDPADVGRFLASDEMRTEQQQEPLKWWPRYDPSQQSQIDKARLRYDEFVASADRAFGAFISQVDRANTIVIVSADHGESFEGGVYTHLSAYQTRPVTHIPLIVRMPGQKEERRAEFTADQSALAPTILELAGQPKPGWMPGRSLAEWIKGNGSGEGLAFTEYFSNSPLSGPLRAGTVGVIDAHNQYVLDLATGKGNFRPLSEAHIWDRDHSRENPAAAEALRMAIYSRFPDLPPKKGMSRQYLNLTGAAWRQLRRNWHLQPTPMLLWQTLVPGSIFSATAALQKKIAGDRSARANYRNAVVVLGYWRSGTTLLHELLCLDPRYTFPSTHACMNPHHFLLTEASALTQRGVAAQRPMDEMEVRPGSPQEDEFALLSLGARSPYEALLIPAVLPQALRLADPRDLSANDSKRWKEIFLRFLAGVSARGEGRPLILKSPTHGFRVDTLRELLPDARFVVIARDPRTHFESVVRMWKRMFELYAIGPIQTDDQIREAVLADRPRFEAKLEAGVAGLPHNRFATLLYEDLAADPAGEIERLYQKLELGDFGLVRDAITGEAAKRRDYRARGETTTDAWSERINETWAGAFDRYGYKRA